MEDEDDILEMDSPLEQPVDADDDEIDEMVLHPGGAQSPQDMDQDGVRHDKTSASTNDTRGQSRQVNGTDHKQASGSGPRDNIGMDKPINYAAKPKDRSTLLHYPESLPYKCESLEEFDARLQHICQRLVTCVRTRDFDVGFVQWNHRLQCLMSLKYPIEQQTHARLARLYYHLTLTPGLEARLVDLAARTCMTLLRGRKKLSIAHLVLPWRPLYDLLHLQLYPKAREPVGPYITDVLLDLAEDAQRFFDPDEAEAMLQEMLPEIDSFVNESLMSAVGLLVHMLPITHPGRWLPTIFKLWESFSFTTVDQQMLDLCARIVELHVEDPRVSTQKAKDEIGCFADLGREECKSSSGSVASSSTTSEVGLWKDVGIFTEHQFAFLMTKCLRAAGLPIGASGARDKTAAATSRPSTHPLKKPSEQQQSYATILVYSMCKDAESPSPTPAGSATPNADMKSSAAQPTYLAGSRALDALARYIQATESYFHPSNWGIWAWPLSNFVKNLAWEFCKRWHEEEKSDCKTPKAFRLTPDIRSEFCTTLRTVCLLSMFSKDPLTIAASQSSLKRLALLEPELIMPPVLERAYSSLEALETTHRTSATITTLSSLSTALVSRGVYKEGGKHIAPLLHLCIPGIDLNDSVKTMSTAMFILTTCMTIKLDDLTRPELSEHASDGMDLDEEEDALRLSTAGFEDWTVSFFRRVLALFEALPEEGKGGRTGGKMEESIIHTVLAACDAVCCSMSEHLFDINFKIVAEYCLTTVAAQSVRVAGSLVSCFARHNSKKVMKRLVRPCAQVIRMELKQGASSMRTTSTSLPLASDIALHWHFSILIGALTFAGKEILEYKTELLELVHDVTERTYTERGYSLAAVLVQRIIMLLIGIYADDSRPLNPSEWQASETDRGAHKYWGRTYAVKEVEISWHVPSDDEIAFALEILDEVVSPRLAEIEQMQDAAVVRDKIWSNDFCRKLSLLRLTYVAFNSFIKEDEAGGGKVALDAGDDVPEFLSIAPRFESGFILADQNDPRYQKVMAFKTRFKSVLHLAAQRTQDSEAEDQIDCVKLLIRSMRTSMVSYGFCSDDYTSYSRSVTLLRTLATMYPKQKHYPRVFWLRRAAYYHTSRGRLNSFHRQRKEIDDKLITQVLEFTMSNYVGIRRTAQNALETLSQHYDGTRKLCFQILLDNLKTSTSDDRIKGSLYVLGSKYMSALGLLDARYSHEYIMSLLLAQGHSKPSIQKLLRGVIHDFIVRFPEPCTIRDKLAAPALEQSAMLLDGSLTFVEPIDQALVSAVAEKRANRVAQVNVMTASVMPALLEYAQKPGTHWTFAIFAAQLLRTLVRRDQPVDAAAASYFAKQLSSENPSMRAVCQKAITRLLYFVKLQALSQSPQELLSGKVDPKHHPLKRVDTMQPPSQEWKSKRFARFDSDVIEADTRFYDKDAPGYLVWGNAEVSYLPPPLSGRVFDWEANESKMAIEAELSQEHWGKILVQMAQEKDRDIISPDSVTFVKSVFQIFGISQLEHVKSVLEDFVGQRDRHKHRAAAEVITGLLRGSKHWPREDSARMWAWLEGILGKVVDECAPDCQSTWEGAIDYMLLHRDPRRALQLVNMLVTRSHNAFESSSSPYEQAKMHGFVRSVILPLQAKFTPWRSSMLELYSKHFDTDFNDVRELVAMNVVDLELQRIGPAYSSVQELLTTCAEGIEGASLLSSSEQTSYLQQRLSVLQVRLDGLRAERVSMAQGTPKHDLLALTTLQWISDTISDHRNTSMASSAIDFLPTILECSNLLDNPELSALARLILLKQVSTYMYTDYSDVQRLTRKVMTIIAENNDSWRKQLDALRMLQVVYFHNIFLLDGPLVAEVIEALVQLLSTPRREVSAAASTTLSGIVLCSQRNMVQSLRQRFTATVARHTVLPKRGEPAFADAMTDLHAGILGATALIGAFPYSVPKWMPSLICDTVARHQDSPDPVGQACKKMAADFKRTHQDTWQEDKEQFTEDQLIEYYAWGGRSDYYA